MAKLRSSWSGPFCNSYFVCPWRVISPWYILTLSSDTVVLYGNIAFSILLLSPRKQYSSFLIKLFLFQKTCFNFKAFKTLKISSCCRIKTYRFLRGLFPIIYGRFLEAPVLFLLDLKWNLYDKAFVCVKTKTNAYFAVKVVEKIKCSFPIWQITWLKDLSS